MTVNELADLLNKHLSNPTVRLYCRWENKEELPAFFIHDSILIGHYDKITWSDLVKAEKATELEIYVSGYDIVLEWRTIEKTQRLFLSLKKDILPT